MEGVINSDSERKIPHHDRPGIECDA